MKFLTYLLMTFACGVVAMKVRNTLDWPYWAYFVLCAVTALVLICARALLMKKFVADRPYYGMADRLNPAGRHLHKAFDDGVIPMWVWWLGAVGVGFMFAIPFELLARQFR